MKTLFQILVSSSRGNANFWKKVYLHTIIKQSLEKYCQAEFPSLYKNPDSEPIKVAVVYQKKILSIRISSQNNNLLVHFKQSIEFLNQVIFDTFEDSRMFQNYNQIEFTFDKN